MISYWHEKIIYVLGILAIPVAVFAGPQLIYSTTFDSKESVVTPDVGPAGVAEGCEFVEGCRGKAMKVVAGQPSAVVTLPAGFVGSKGCVCFCAKICGDSDLIEGASSPRFFEFWYEDERLSHVQYTVNDTDSRSGLNGFFFCLPVATWKELKNSPKYSDVLGNDQSFGWHHYAYSWDLNGIAALSADKGIKVYAALYVDGELYEVSDVSPSEDGLARINEYSKKMATLAFPIKANDLLPETNTRDFLIDEFKIWDGAKTSFEDVIPWLSSDVALPVVSNVTAHQHYPWCGKIDISYKITGDTEGLLTNVVVKDNQNNMTYDAKTFDIQPTAAVGTHKFVWDATADGVNQMSANMVVTVSLIVPED